MATLTLDSVDGTSTSSLVGRDDDLAQVLGLLESPGNRLVTITGGGGFGKTALALDIARTLATSGVRVRVVELASVDHPSLVLPTVARAFGVSTNTSADLAERLTAEIGREPVLLVLDNLEHLDVTDFVCHFLASTPNVRILATSRRRLNLSREYVYSLAPLPIPETADQTLAMALVTNPAVNLLIERLCQAGQRLIITPANAQMVFDLTRQLEGIPLAIELAARHGRLLSLAEILDQVVRQQDVLRGGAADLPPRQQAMQASIQWSLDLLSIETRSAFCRLCLFRDAFDCPAAMAVGGLDLESLHALVEDGLITVLPQDNGGRRFRMLIPIREQGLRDAETRGDLDENNRRYCDYVLGLASCIASATSTTEQFAALDTIALLRDDMLAALDWALAHGREVEAAQACVAAERFWTQRTDSYTSRLWLDRVLAAIEDRPVPLADLRARLLYAKGVVAHQSGDLRASEAALDRAIEIARTHQINETLALALLQQISVLRARRQPELALQLVDETTCTVAALDSPLLSMRLYFQLAALALHANDLGEAERCAEIAIRLSAAVDARDHLFGLPGLLALVYVERGELGAARKLYTQALQNPYALEFSRYATLQYLGRLELLENRPLAAAAILEKCLETRLRHGSQIWITAALVDCGWLAAVMGEDTRAVSLFAAAAIHDRTNIDLLVARNVDEVVQGLVSTADASEARMTSVLTLREQEVLAHVALGESNRQIAQTLFIGTTTVDTHVKNILRKLQAPSRSAAVALGLQQGIITPSTG